MHPALKILLFPLKIIIFAFLPFFLLIRGAVLLSEVFDLGAWPALAITVGLSLILIIIYINVISNKLFRKKKKSWKGRLALSLVLVGLFLGYGLMYVSGSNTQSEAVQEEYTSLHPFLRMAVSTVVIVDHDAIVTDMARQPHDYQDMGLKTLKNSLHYPQSDGFVHAVDFRTRDRSEIRNHSLELYFRLMGFRTLRHVGTGDHLHVSLMIKENPRAL